jgi:hypothetical protein
MRMRSVRHRHRENAGGAGGEHARLDSRALVARDFADGHTVLVDGWVLSVTEARQCALFSLLGR